MIIIQMSVVTLLKHLFIFCTVCTTSQENLNKKLIQCICRAPKTSLTVEIGLNALWNEFKAHLSLLATPKSSNAFRWLGDCVFDAKKNLQSRLCCRKCLLLVIIFPVRWMLFCRRLPTDCSEHRIKLSHPIASLF